MTKPTPSICILTAGHLATCPRMVKAADALAGAGYRVRVVSASHGGWDAEDCELRKGRDWEWDCVRFDRASAGMNWMKSGARFRAANAAVGTAGAEGVPWGVAVRAYARQHDELFAAATARPADFFYGGTCGALAATAEAARRAGKPFALDLEDFHTAEQDDSAASRRQHALAARIERKLLPRAAFLTGGSGSISEAYRERYGIDSIPIHNVFPLPAETPDLEPALANGLRVHWFSQTLGPGRGLEDAVRAMGLAGIEGELVLRGIPTTGYAATLERLRAEAAPKIKLTILAPEPPDPVELCRRGRYDVGLSLEQTHVFNRTICLTNKTFTYMLAGMAIAFTDTPAQRIVAAELGEGALLHRHGDVDALAAGLRRWSEDRALLGRAKRASWEAAKRRWHWDHPLERGALLAAFGKALPLAE